MKMNICARKIVGSQEKSVGTQENAVGASGKCQILCKNLQKLSKNEKFHKILQENYIFCAKTALARDKNRWRTISRWRAPTIVGVRQRRCAPTAYSVFCTSAPTAYEHPKLSNKTINFLLKNPYLAYQKTAWILSEVITNVHILTKILSFL